MLLGTFSFADKEFHIFRGRIILTSLGNPPPPFFFLYKNWFDGNMALVLLNVLLQLLLLHPSPVSVSAQRRHAARYFGRIAENSPAGTPVDRVMIPLLTAECPDTNLSASLGGNYASDFRLVHGHRDHRDHRGHLSLVSAKPLDREFIAMYELTVELPPRCRRRAAAIQVEVSDRNDNIPSFTSGNRTVEADELTPLGTELARFDAKDRDAEKNGRVTFYASPEESNLHVVPQTGQVRLVGSLLGLSQVTLRLYVKDRGDVALIGEPVFLRVNVRRSSRVRRMSRALPEDLSYLVTVPDHIRVGDLVFTVPDQRFEQRWFEVISEADSPVQIERDSGRLYLARSLREPAEVVVKIQNVRGESVFFFFFFSSARKNACVGMAVVFGASAPLSSN